LPFKEIQAILDAHDTVRAGVRSRALKNAHDIAEGGISVALAECCIAGGIGAVLRLPENLEPFGEDFGTGFIVSGARADLDGLTIIGEVGGDSLKIEGLLEVALPALRTAHSDGLGEALR